MASSRNREWLVTAGCALGAMAVAVIWFFGVPRSVIVKPRFPGADNAGEGGGANGQNPVLTGKLTKGVGQPASLPGRWQGFRGTMRDGISKESIGLLKDWSNHKPRELWALDLGEGYAGAAVANGRVYVMDYDAQKKEDALKCVSLADGQEIWRFTYPNSVKRNHGMSRSVPTVSDKYVVAMGPKCHVTCVGAESGELRWGLDLVKEFGATIPPWYAGQCPLIDGTNVILAPGGKDALLIACDLATGKALWQSTNAHSWKMTHSSIMPIECEGERMYVYCADKGVAGVSARDGQVLWETAEWKISIATVPSPMVVPGGRLFLSGGYNAGSLMLQVKKKGDRFAVEQVFKLGPEVFGATQHTPILLGDHIYGARADGKFVCLSLDGKVAWTSEAGASFGLGSFVIADGLILALNDSGLLRAIEASPDKCRILGQAQVLNGRESWGPMAIAGTRLIARDFTRMTCLDMAEAKKD